MKLVVECPACAKRFRVPEQYAGKRVKCSQCAEPISVPARSDDDEADDEEESFEDDLPSTPQRRHRPNPKSKSKNVAESKKRTSKNSSSVVTYLLLIASGVFVVGAIFVVLIVINMAPRAITDPEICKSVDQATNELGIKTAAVDVVTHFIDAPWTLDQDAGEIVFNRKDGFQVKMPIQIIGTYDSTDHTWLWSWDNPSIEAKLRENAETVRKYGHDHNVAAFTTRKLTCLESDCWDFTAMACKLCNTQSAYRCPTGSTRVYVTLGEAQLSKP